MRSTECPSSCISHRTRCYATSDSTIVIVVNVNVIVVVVVMVAKALGPDSQKFLSQT